MLLCDPPTHPPNATLLPTQCYFSNLLNAAFPTYPMLLFPPTQCYFSKIPNTTFPTYPCYFPTYLCYFPTYL